MNTFDPAEFPPFLATTGNRRETVMIEQKSVPMLFLALALCWSGAGCGPSKQPPRDAASENTLPSGPVIPREFYGTWIETGDDGKQLAKMDVKEQAINWTAPDSSSQAIAATQLTISGDQKTLSFSSTVVIAEGVFMPTPAIIGKPSVTITRDSDSLLVKISEVRLKSDATGFYTWKGPVSVSREVINGKLVSTTTLPESTHRYLASKS
jgi:hypothetical protein